MNNIAEITIKICIILIISVLAIQLTDGSRYSAYVRFAATLVMLLLLINLITGLKFQNLSIINMDNYKINDSQVWNNALQNTSEVLEDEMYKLCYTNGINIESINVFLETDMLNIKISSVEISGDESYAAKNLIASHFKIDRAYIDIDGE